MTGKTHLIGGIASLSLLLLWPAPIALNDWGMAIAGAVVGSLLPDLDAPVSQLSRFQAAGVRPFALPALVLSHFLTHRGFSHSLLGWLLASLIVALPLGVFVSPWLGTGLALGYGSHLLLDMMTKSGVPLLWPDKTRRHVLPPPLRISTGKPEEGLALAFFSAVAVGTLLPLLFHRPAL